VAAEDNHGTSYSATTLTYDTVFQHGSLLLTMSMISGHSAAPLLL